MGFLDPVELAQVPLDPVHAGGTGHALHIEGERACSLRLVPKSASADARARPFRLVEPGFIPGGLDRATEVLCRELVGPVVDGGGLGREVDVGFLDPVELAQVPLDTVHAGGTGHALDGDADPCGRDGGSVAGHRSSARCGGV